jgi:hypothetical protein
MNAPSKDKDPVRTNTELDYAPPWARDSARDSARESAREPMRPLSVERPAILTQQEPDEIASGESRISREERPWHQRALEPELVPEPAGSISNFWPTMLRMGLVCGFAAVVAAAVVLLFNPKQSVHKGLQANAPPPSATAEKRASSFVEPGPIVPALTAERSASANAPQPPPAQDPGAAAPPQAIASAMPNQPPVNVETPAAAANRAPPAQPPIVSQPSPQPVSPNSPIGVIPPPPGDASPPQAAASPEPPPVSSSTVKQGLARQPQTLDEGEISSLIARGNKFLKDGDFAAARLLFERAANAGSAEAALALGSTYDPAVIKRLGAIAVKPDVETARNWYQIAAERGSAAAKLQLANLPSSH